MVLGSGEQIGYALDLESVLFFEIGDLEGVARTYLGKEGSERLLQKVDIKANVTHHFPKN